jgi:hypothetical protein
MPETIHDNNTGEKDERYKSHIEIGEKQPGVVVSF